MTSWAAALGSAATVCGAAYLLLGALTWWYTDRIIFQPQPSTYTVGAGISRVPVTEEDSIAVLWLPNPRARYTILYSHGNAEDLGDLRPFLADLRDAGFSVLAYDYRGYGASSPGTPTESGAYADLAAAYEYLTHDLGTPPERVILHGRSLGGAIASYLASRRPAAGLILESTFVSAFRAAVSRPLFPFDRFATARRLREVDAPVLVIHGKRDEVVPFWHGGALLHAAKPPRSHYWVQDAGHNDLVMAAGPRYWLTLRHFAASLDSTPRAPDR